MKSSLRLCLLLVFLLSGCISQRENQEALPPATLSFKESKNAFIFVDETNKGVTPANILIRRSFGASVVTLRTGPKLTIVRAYEIEQTNSSSRSMMDYSYNQSYEENVISLNVQDLQRLKDGTYSIPYYDSPIKIEDLEYNFTFIIQ